MIRPRYERHEQHGFIEFIVGSISEGGTVKLSVCQYLGRAKEFTLITRTSDHKSIFFNSYFIDDGEYEFKLRLISNQLNTITDHTANYRVCNGSSKLASDLHKAFRADVSYALTQGPLDSTYFSLLPDEFICTNYPLQSRTTQKSQYRILSTEQVLDFDRDGVLILSTFFEKDAINKAREALMEVNEKELFRFKKGTSQRIVNLHESYEELNKIYSSRRLYDVVSDLLGVQAFPCQSLTFINGSTQDPHQDSVHLTPFPRGLMCGIWIAIEDVVAGGGELLFFPGSHSLPAVLCSTHHVPKVNSEDEDYSKFEDVYTPQIKELLDSNPDLEANQFLAKAGDVLIWQENLIHGGGPRTIPDQTRMSMVIHAFGEPALIYYDSLGMSGKRDTSLN